MVDGALGGLGGCPFAPGASGNTSTEDMLFATRPEWLTPARFADLVGSVRGAARRTRRTEPVQRRAGRAVEGRRVRWVIPRRRPHLQLSDRGNSFLVTTAIPEPGTATCCTTAGKVDGRCREPLTAAELGERVRLRSITTSSSPSCATVFDAPVLAGARSRDHANYAVGYNNIDIDAATRPASWSATPPACSPTPRPTSPCC